VEATGTVALSNSFSSQLASRGSADEVFWNNVIETMINEYSPDHSIGGGECVPPSCPAAGSLSSSSSPSTSSTASDANSVDKSSVQTYIDIHTTKNRVIFDAVCRNRASLDQNIYMFPKPLPSFSDLSTSPESEKGRTSMDIDDVEGGASAIGMAGDGKSVLNHQSGGINGCMQTDDLRFDSKIFRNRKLGKRGRLYDEVWDEGDYLEKKSALIEICNSSPHLVPFRPGVVTNWNEILNHYSDDHDGVYVDYLLDQALSRNKQRKNDEIYNLKKEGDRLKLNLKRDEGILSLCSPPVPVSCHHPASWGKQPRRRGSVTTSKRFIDPTMGLDIDRKKRGNGSNCSSTSSEAEDEVFDPSRWHPASYTAETVMSVTYCSSPRQKSRNSSFGVPAGEEDTDELNLHLDSLLNELAVQSASNFMMLSKLTKSVGMELNLQSMRKQHRALQDAHLKVSNFFVKTNEEIRNAAAKASLQQQRSRRQGDNAKPGDDRNGDVYSLRKSKRTRVALADPPCSLSTSNANQEMCPGSSSESTGESKSTTKVPVVNGSTIQSKLFRHKIIHRHEECRKQPSSVKICQSLESFGSTIREGDLVEVCSTGGVWSLCAVRQCQTDSSGARRLIQVRAVGGCDSDVQWVYLDDGVIAEPGTNVPSFIVNEARNMLP